MMSDKLDASAAKALDKITNAADAVVAKLGTLAEKYGPEVIDSALWVVRVNALQDIAFGLLFAAAAVFLLRGAPGHMKSAAEKQAAYRKAGGFGGGMPEGDASFAAGFASYAAGIISLIIAAFVLVSPWPYIALAEPKLWVAKRLLGL